MSSTVDPVTVTPPKWGWGYNGFYNTADMKQSSDITSLEAAALDMADGAAQNQSAHAQAESWENTSENIVASLIVIAQRQGNQHTIDGPGSTPNFTGVQLYDNILNWAIIITDEYQGPTGALTYTKFDPQTGKAHFEIKINPAGVGNYFNDPTLNMSWTIFHELGHSMDSSAALGKGMTGPLSAWQHRLLEQFANSMGSELAKAINFPFPNAEIQGGDFNGFLDPSFSGPFSGTVANDVLAGTQGSELLNGLDGDDLLSASSGHDYLVGGAGVDTVTFAGSASGAYVNLSVVESDTQSMGRDIFEGIENLVGSAYADTMQGSSGANTISGAAGSDLLMGGAGDDSIAGGDGDDSVQGGEGNDFLHGNGGFDQVFGNQGNDTVHGGQVDDVLRGGQNDDLLSGDAGNDLLVGDTGNDRLIGGAGADTYYVNSSSGADLILDFTRSEGDRVRVEFGSYGLYQSGPDTIIDFFNGSQAVLKNVTLSNLDAGWIYT